MPSEHAKLSASGSKRWIECTKSVFLESFFPDDISSKYALEGTAAHDLAQYRLEAILTPGNHNSKELTTDKEMSEYVDIYVSKCIEIYEEVKESHEDTVCFVEERVDFSNTVPGGFGTTDFLVIGGKTIHIIDLKYGKGIEVSADRNTQLSLYAIGAIQKYGMLYDIEDIYLHIIQPRISNYSSSYITIDEIKAFKEKVNNRAIIALNNEGTYNPGKAQCQFCKAKIVCKARSNNFINIINSIVSKKRGK